MLRYLSISVYDQLLAADGFYASLYRSQFADLAAANG